jgi:hypothetical protein
MADIELRLFRISLGIALAGCLLVWLYWGTRAGLSFAAGSVLGGLNLSWLRLTLAEVFSGDLKRAKLKVLGGFFLRLLLIPLCLYVMIRFLFLDVLAVVAGFAVLICSVFVEGVLEVFGSNPK